MPANSSRKVALHEAAPDAARWLDRTCQPRVGERFYVAQVTANPAARDVCGSGREN
jgi:hypothetical protein